MAARGPTQGAERHAAGLERWKAHPGLARALRVLIITLPLGVSLLFTLFMGSYFPPQKLGLNRWLWMVSVFFAANILLYILGRITRQLVPLVGLMKLTLVFPDQAPSRTKAVLRRSNSRTMLRELQALEGTDTSSVAGAHADYLVQLLQDINEHDRLTRGHSERVRAYSELLGEELGLRDDEMDKLRWSALLHDVGKLDVPAEILNKDGRPTDEEWKLLQGHPAASRAYLEPLRPWLGEWVHSADQHHCRFDGGGYPETLSGHDISLAGRLVAIADAYDVMTSARSYKKPLSSELARQELTACAGEQFDPKLVREFLHIGLGQLKAVAGPLAWIANLTGSARLPIPAASAAATTAWTTAVASIGLAVAGISSPPIPDEPLAFVAPLAEEAESTTSSPSIEERAPVRLTSTSTDASTTTVVLTSTPTTAGVAPVVITTNAPSISTLVTSRQNTTSSSTAISATTTTTTAATTSTAVTTTTTAPPVYRSPVPASDMASVFEDISVLIDVLANDSDPDGDALLLTSVSTTAHGVAVLESSQIRYTPDQNFNGTDSFAYTISDGSSPAVSTLVTIDVLPANDVPQISAGSASIQEDALVGQFVLSANVSDLDGDVLSVSISTGDPGGLFVVDDNGTLRLAAALDHELIDAHMIELTVSDGTISAATTVTVMVLDVNEPPVATANSLTAAHGGAATSVDVRLNDSDVDGDALTVTSVSVPANGIAAHNGDGTITYTHDGSQTQSDSFTYAVDDGNGATATGVVSVTVVPPEDGDAVSFAADVCSYDFDPMQLDTDGDGIGDVCDPMATAVSTALFADSGQVLDATGRSYSVALGDVDNDGDLDALFANALTGNTMYLNDGAGVFADSGQTLGSGEADSATFGDLDGDGDLDVILTNKLLAGDSVWFNDGAGVFTDSGQSLGADNGGGAVVADVDGDGDLDLVIANLDAANALWLNNGSGIFSNSGQDLGTDKATGVAAGDLDGDRDLDLVFGHEEQDNTVWLNDGAGVFSNSGQVLGANRTHDVALADLDGDGDLDIVFAEDGNMDTVWLNNGLGAFTDSGQLIGVGHSHSVDIGDLDGDGDVDLVFGDHLGDNTVWLNNGSGVFSNSGQVLGSSETEGVALGDLDGDGDLDLIAANDVEVSEVWFNP